ncbi:MAG: 1-acyl-sn-glycerol-3-phosphate acyltransferase [Hyphomicrobiales bacterium]|nr:1-acyl-sn-glycerol-3-phosphate acyltransferase [Hyphomicrobiales bacterium]MCP5371052.1 1-acyl-sn-glycerol-3-phosphate acyltransferase [Hyphomicrobiales bacterium]
MQTIRSLLFNVYFFAWLIFVLLLMWLFLPFPRAVMQEVVRVWSRGLQVGARLLVGIRYEVRGRENLPAGAAVIASKHQSAWDTAIFYMLLPDPIYIMKQELMRIPLWGWYARKCQAIGVDRAGGASALKAMVRDTLAALDRDRQVIIFPEGTRTPPGTRRPYHPGVAAIYARSAAPLVPVALNSGLFWGRRSFLKHPGTITLEFLEPIPPGLPRKAFVAALQDRIETGTDRLVAEARQRFDLPPPDAEKVPEKVPGTF